jgi:hypothetical protein
VEAVVGDKVFELSEEGHGSKRIATLPPLQSPPAHSGKRGLRDPTLAFATV